MLKNHEDRMKVLVNLGELVFDDGAKVIFNYTNGRSYTATNVVAMEFGETELQYRTFVEKFAPVARVDESSVSIQLKDVKSVSVHTDAGTVVTTFRVR